VPNLRAEFVLFWLLFVHPCFPQTAGSPPVDRGSAPATETAVRLSEILISTPQPFDPAQAGAARQKAEQLRAEIGPGGTFADIARDNSQGSTAAQGGDLGCFTHGKLAPPLDELVFRMKVGDVSEVLQTKQGFVILEVTDRGANCADLYSSKHSASERYGPIDVLTDTKGVDLNAYLQPVLNSVRKNWYKLIPESARAPIMKKGKVAITFRVMKDGKITGVQLAESSGDVALDRAAYGGVTESSPLSPLPSAFSCDFLTLRFRFYYNPGQGEDFPRESSATRVPCVTTAIRFGGEIGVTVSPASAQVVAGAGQQFLAAVTGEVGSAVSWSVGGSGCVAASCGIITTDGLYTAPLGIPNPATVTVTATLAATPSQTANATVTIMPPSSPSR